MDFLSLSNIDPFVRNGRFLLSMEEVSEEEDNSERLYNDFIRTLEFLWVFGIFSIGYCSLSFYIYRRPYDTPKGTSFASKIRRIPYLGWFYRQPFSALQAKSQTEESKSLIAHEDGDEPDTQIDIVTDKKEEDGPFITKENGISGSGTPKKIIEEAKSPVSAAGGGHYYVMGSPNLTLVLCALCLLLAYLTWGFMQERIMGHPYGDKDLEENWFQSSAFCVLVNRMFGVIVSTSALSYMGRSGNDCPPFYYSLCALSNMMSSWLQYESLHYVTFPVQTIFKSSKVLITMGVGKLLMNKTFRTQQYISAACIGIGVYIFLDAQRKANAKDDTDMGEEEADLGWYFYLGLILVAGYAFSDAFTSNWQSKVFAQTKVSSLEMMQGVNMFTFVVSLVFCAPQFPYIYHFYATHPMIIFHSLIMGLCAGFGQVLIFFTIKTFGAVKFATVMTTRMVFSVLISIVYYKHAISKVAIVGMCITFMALFYQAFSKGQKGKR